MSAKEPGDKEFKLVRKAFVGLGEPFKKAQNALKRASKSDPAKVEELKEEILRQLYASKELETAMRAYTKKVMEEEDDGESVIFTGPPVVKRSLREIVQAKGMSQVELARKAKMDPAMLSRVFKNPDNSKLGTLRRIAKALNVDIAQVV